MGATHFPMKRLKNVRTEMALSVLAYNLTRCGSCREPAVMGISKVAAGGVRPGW